MVKSYKKILLISFLLLSSLLVSAAFAQTSTYLDSNIVTVQTQSGGGGTGTIYVKVRVGGQEISQSSPCRATVSTFSEGDCIQTIPNAPVGTYTVTWKSGTFPTGAITTVVPVVSDAQVLASGGSATFYIDFDGAYIISCVPKNSDSIEIFWSGKVSSAHTIRLYGANSSDPLHLTDATNSIYFALSGSANSFFRNSGLSPNTQRWYVLVTRDQATDNTTESNTVDCTTKSSSVDTPTFFSVFANSPSVIYLNWKDNVTSNRLYHFEIQRIKATPRSSTDFKGVSRSAASVSFSWKNNTGYAPYNSVLERSTSLDASTRFSSSDPFIPLTPNSYDPYANGNRTGDPMSPSTNFNYTNLGLAEATAYYYRLKTCFPDPVNNFYTKAGGSVVLNLNKPIFACSDYADGGKVIATTTQPIAPSNLVATSTSPSVIAISWKDNSAKEEGFRIYRDGVSVATLGASPATGATLTFNNDSGLNSGTTYAYTVKSFITDPLSGAELVSAVSNSATAITWVTLTVSSPAGGSISGTGISCGATCSKVFKVGDPVTLAANSNTDYGFTEWTGGVCVGSSATCTFTISGDASVGATFTYVPPDLCPNVDGTQTTTPCADVTCTAGGGTWNTVAQSCAAPPPTGTVTVVKINPTDGTVTGSGINCGGVCGITVALGSSVSLTAASSSGYSFSNWTGGCDGSTNPSCTFTLNATTTVTANFAVQAPQPLGPGSGDANGDGFVTCADVTLMNQAISGSIVLSPAQQLRADVSGNGTVSSYDVALLLQRYNLSCPAASAAPAGGVAVSDNPQYANIYVTAKETVSGWWSGLTSIFKNGWNVVAGLFNSIGVKEAEAVTDGVYNNYFGLKKFQVTVPSYKDIGLDANSTYIYRVRVVYDDGTSPATSQWSDMGAGNTLSNLSPLPDQTPAPICTSNSFCDRSITTTKTTDVKGAIMTSESQCGVNADCANVGRASKTFKEQ
ncbi:hypothetical protein D4R51_00240 [bacterium]|nr:MAG: hypothetical protein D4R51_00240 [bacterium]